MTNSKASFVGHGVRSCLLAFSPCGSTQDLARWCIALGILGLPVKCSRVDISLLNNMKGQWIAVRVSNEDSTRPVSLLGGKHCDSLRHETACGDRGTMLRAQEDVVELNG